MKFATARQIVLLTFLSFAALLTLDYFKNPQLWHHQSAEGPNHEGAQLTLWINHACNRDCVHDVQQALANVPGIAVDTATTPSASAPQELQHPGAAVVDVDTPIDIAVNAVDKLDFVALDQALRAKGIVAGHMEFGGVDHFSLEATVPRLYDTAAGERFAFLKARSNGQFRWLDSVDVDSAKGAVVAYARFLEAGKTVDVSDFLTGLNEIGYAPLSLQVRVGEHMNLVSHAVH